MIATRTPDTSQSVTMQKRRVKHGTHDVPGRLGGSKLGEALWEPRKSQSAAPLNAIDTGWPVLLHPSLIRAALSAECGVPRCGKPPTASLVLSSADECMICSLEPLSISASRRLYPSLKLSTWNTFVWSAEF